MIRYYWYITLNPKKTSQNESYNLDSFIKRAISPPPGDLFYILESLDGYRHSLKEKGSSRPPTQYDDNGNRSEIHDISEHIVRRLKEEWRKENHRASYLKQKERERENKIITSEISSTPDIFEYMDRNGDLPFISLRKRKSLNTSANRCKCKKPIRKSIKKVKRRT